MQSMFDLNQKLGENILQRDEYMRQYAEKGLEADLYRTNWMLSKVRDNTAYAQNLYAALCNNVFQPRHIWPVLKNENWSCTWRYAGGIVAFMRQEGDYLDWYCSGIANIAKFVDEGHVTDEVRADLMRMGWAVINKPN